MLPADFGLAARSDDSGWVNTTEQGWLEQQAKSGRKVSAVAADELEAQGNAFDATMTRKQAVERSRSNQSTFSSGKPGSHQ